MHYYPHHIGDFIKETSRLTDHQTITYLRLIWMYYESESPLPDDIEVLAMQTGSDTDTVSILLRAYFLHMNGVWVQMRCDSEIRKYQKKATSARMANEARWSDSRLKSETKTDAQHNRNQIATNNQEPITNNHIKNNMRKSAFVPPIPNSIISAWKEVRKAKRAGAITEIVWKAIERESSKAGITPEQAVQICCERGWQSFNADWYLKPSSGKIENEKPWFITSSGIEAKAKEFGLELGRDEQFHQFSARVKKQAGVTPEMERKARMDFGTL